MANNTRNEYIPDSVSCPGETLLETITALGMTQTELARRTGRPVKTINEIINGKAALTPETALQLERVLGVPARFWNNRERHYREHMASEQERERLASETEWLEQLPLKEMIKRGWVRSCADPVEQIRILLDFFGVTSPRPWQELCPPAAYRNAKAFERNPASVAAWLRRGELLARDASCDPFSKAQLRRLFPQLRGLVLMDPNEGWSRARALCASGGVAAVCVAELPGTRVCGVARWLTPEKALVQLSLRYRTTDQFWFSFFHEIGHVLLHGKTGFFVDTGESADEVKEGDADRFAGDLPIPPAPYRSFCQAGIFTEGAICRFAQEQQTDPGIVVGRLQHDRLLDWRSACNHLKSSTTLSCEGCSSAARHSAPARRSSPTSR